MNAETATLETLLEDQGARICVQSGRSSVNLEEDDRKKALRQDPRRIFRFPATMTSGCADQIEV